MQGKSCIYKGQKSITMPEAKGKTEEKRDGLEKVKPSEAPQKELKGYLRREAARGNIAF